MVCCGQESIRAGGGRVGLDNLTLFAANSVILYVMAAAFFIAGRGRQGEPYWDSWFVANMLLGTALVFFMLEKDLPPFLLATVPNGLLVVGFGLRWRAAREFGRRTAPGLLVWGPGVLFVALCAVPVIGGSYPLVYTGVNAILTLVALATAREFWHDRSDRLPSRYGLVAAYAIMGLSFASRVVQGVIEGAAIGPSLPYDTMLQAHLLVAVFHTSASGAFALSTAYERSDTKLKHAASHDSLTGLLNRGAFETLVAQRLATPAPGPFAIVLLDIDHFKQINDKYGHAAGDRALRACADTCRAELRTGDAMARIGGEEFAVILDGAATEEEAVRVTERMRRAVGAARTEGGERRFGLTISAGVCHTATTPATFDAMMRVADERLYSAKRDGRNRVARTAA